MKLLKVGIALLGVLCLFKPINSHAAYPDRTITAIVPFGPGGPSDVMARIVAAGMAKELGQTIVMENKAGAAGNIGIAVVAHAKPDGYTLLFCSVATTQNPAVFRNLPYDPLKDLTPVAIFGTSPFVIGINAEKFPQRNLKDFVNLVRETPGKYNIAAGGGGQRMTLERFMLELGVKMVLVNYDSGSSAANAVMGGESDLVINDGTTMGSVAASGKVRLLAVAGNTRLASMPDVPTTAESGFPSYTDQNYPALYVPAGTPNDLVARLHDIVNKVVASPEVDQRFRSLGYTPAQKTQQEFDTFYREEVARWKDVAQKAHVPPVD